MEKLNRILEFEKQFSSIELSLKLKKLGVSQDTCFMWVLNKPEHPCAGWSVFANSLVSQKLSWEDRCAAYSCAELGEMLPNTVQTKDGAPFDNFRISIRKFHTIDEQRALTNNFIINYECDSTETNGQDAWIMRKLTTNIYDPNEANARAKMFIYLIENKLHEV